MKPAAKLPEKCPKCGASADKPPLPAAQAVEPKPFRAKLEDYYRFTHGGRWP